MVWHFTGRGTAYYGSWYGILRVMVRRVSISIEHRDTETQRNLFLSVLIRAIRAKKMGGNRRTQYVAFLQPCGMQAGHTWCVPTGDVFCVPTII